jgi:UPF0271 protein
MRLSPSEVYDLVLYQVGALHAFLHVYGAKLHHVKPHGALYNMAASDRALADAIALSLLEFDKQIILYGLSGSELIHAAAAHGLQTCSEVFADRSYQEDGSLTPRNVSGAILQGVDESLEQVMMMINERQVKSVTGKRIPICAETICLHGDHVAAIDCARAISHHLKAADVIIQQP